MLQDSLKNIFAVPDLRKRVLFTLGLLAVYRVGSHIVTPGINKEALALMAEQARNTMFGLYDMFSGQNLSQMTIFALGIMPYISASIILQLLTVVWPYLERLSKEGELGRRKITQYTRYGTIVLSIVQALGIAFFLERNTGRGRRPAARVQPGLGVPVHDRADADDRFGVRDVARGADHRARHRQRYVAHHLRRDCRRAAARRHCHHRAVGDRADDPVPPDRADGADGLRDWGDHLRRARTSAESPCSTPSGWSGGGCTAARARTFRSR